MHYYQFNISVWSLHTSHLTLEEECIYRRLLDYYYDTELPIPEETKPVIRRLRLLSNEPMVKAILQEFFHLETDGWHNNRADIEISEYHAKANKARENGKKGGRPKENKGIETKVVILANPEETTSKANYELLTNNYELETSKELITPQAASPKVKATRLPSDWKPTQEHWDAAILINSDLGPRLKLIAETFRDYWIAKSGQSATKMDWMATWKNWIRREVQNAGYQQPNGARVSKEKITDADRVRAQARRAIERIDAEANGTAVHENGGFVWEQSD